jgi:hypothetical protein
MTWRPALKWVAAADEAEIRRAFHALENNSLGELEKSLTAAIHSELHKRFNAANEARKHAEDGVEAGRRFVRAYAQFVHYVDGVHRTAAGTATEHDATEQK